MDALQYLYYALLFFSNKVIFSIQYVNKQSEVIDVDVIPMLRARQSSNVFTAIILLYSWGQRGNKSTIVHLRAERIQNLCCDDPVDWNCPNLWFWIRLALTRTMMDYLYTCMTLVKSKDISHDVPIIPTDNVSYLRIDYLSFSNFIFA